MAAKLKKMLAKKKKAAAAAEKASLAAEETPAVTSPPAHAPTPVATSGAAVYDEPDLVFDIQPLLPEQMPPQTPSPAPTGNVCICVCVCACVVSVCVFVCACVVCVCVYVCAVLPADNERTLCESERMFGSVKFASVSLEVCLFLWSAYLSRSEQVSVASMCYTKSFWHFFGPLVQHCWSFVCVIVAPPPSQDRMLLKSRRHLCRINLYSARLQFVWKY